MKIAALDRLAAPSENALILGALALSAVFLIAFCLVVSGVVRSAEQQHRQAGQAVVAEPADRSS